MAADREQVITINQLLQFITGIIDISRLNVYIAKGDISRLIFSHIAKINVYGRKERYTEIKIRNEQRISIHLGTCISMKITVKPVQFDICLRAFHAKCHAPTGAIFSSLEKYLSKIAQVLLAGLTMVGKYDS